MWSSVSPFAWWSSTASSTDFELEMIAVGAVGIAVLGGPLERLEVELPAVDDSVVTGSHDVAVEPGRQRFVGHHHRFGPSGLGRLGGPHRHAEDVIDVPVGVDRRVQPAR